MAKRKVLLPEVRSLSELRTLARGDPRYERLAITAATNLGKAVTTLEEAMRWLLTNAAETSEDGVIGEVNYVRDLI